MEEECAGGTKAVCCITRGEVWCASRAVFLILFSSRRRRRRRQKCRSARRRCRSRSTSSSRPEVQFPRSTKFAYSFQTNRLTEAAFWIRGAKRI